MEDCSNFFYHHICHSCKIRSHYIRTCSGCKLVSYCSKIHQKKDWKNHKPVCTIVQVLLKECNTTCVFGSTAINACEWRRKLINVICAVEMALRRPLEIYEMQMFLFPNVCPLCYVPVSDKKYICGTCYYTCYCSLEHKYLHLKEHEKECSSFQLSYKTDMFYFESPLGLVHFDVPYFKDNVFPENMDSFLNKYADTYSDILKVLLSEHVSGTLSLLYSVNSTLFLSQKDEVTIHVIGARNYEQSLLMTIEMLFHWFPFVNKLNLVLIGPEICDNYQKPEFCEECRKNKSFSVHKEKKLYHEYISSHGFSVPNVIVSFNCGFSEFVNTDNDLWKESIKCIWNFNNILLVFTSYTESEADADFSAVLERKPNVNNIRYITKTGRNISCPNPYKSLRPYRNWEKFECSVFYNNNYITIIKINC